MVDGELTYVVAKLCKLLAAAVLMDSDANRDNPEPMPLDGTETLIADSSNPCSGDPAPLVLFPLVLTTPPKRAE